MTSPPSPDPYAAAAAAADKICAETGCDSFHIAVVLGSGWASVADELGTVRAAVALDEFPGFITPTVAGHRNALAAIDVGETRVLLFAGRAHLYEGVDVGTVVHPVRTAAAAGCRAIVLTNAAGSLNPSLLPGQPVLLSDHLNLTGTSPLLGPEPPPGYPSRFCDMTGAYSTRLRALAGEVEPLPEGVYAGLPGGNYETPAEVEMLARLGADLVGMSTVLETIAARHLGLEVLGVSLVTNMAAGITGAPLDHHDVLAQAEAARPRIVELIRSVVRNAPAT